MFLSWSLLFIDEGKSIQLALSKLCNTALNNSRTVQIRSRDHQNGSLIQNTHLIFYGTTGREEPLAQLA